MRNENFGFKLRHQRRVLGLKLHEIAERAGCSESMISKIETGRISPSLNLLHRIAATLNLNMSSLFSEEGTTDVVSRKGSRPRIRAGNAPNTTMERLVPNSPDALLEGTLYSIEPMGSLGDPITHLGEEMGIVLEGMIALEVDGKTSILNEGDSFYFKSDRLHTYRNKGTTTARMIVVSTPPTF